MKAPRRQQDGRQIRLNENKTIQRLKLYQRETDANVVGIAAEELRCVSS